MGTALADRVVRALPRRAPGACDLVMPLGAVRLAAELRLPPAAAGIVLIAHGSGSSLGSPPSRGVARALVAAGLGTLLLDLRTAEETAGRRGLLDAALLAERLLRAGEWLVASGTAPSLPIGYHGVGTAAAAVLAAAARAHGALAIVSQSGRPDLSAAVLSRIRAPTLLIVGGDDYAVAQLNRQAYARLWCRKRLSVVAGASFRFDSPGESEQVERLAAEWFVAALAG